MDPWTTIELWRWQHGNGELPTDGDHRRVIPKLALRAMAARLESGDLPAPSLASCIGMMYRIELPPDAPFDTTASLTKRRVALALRRQANLTRRNGGTGR